jgi:2-phospho-L-lactate guanylyltransferase (CobY/MobA/RfbA family)
LDTIHRVVTPDNFVQAEVRSVALYGVLDILPDNLDHILPQMLGFWEETLENADNRARREQESGALYNEAFKLYRKEEYLARGEEHLRKAVELAPGRQGTAFVLVENLTLQGRFDELKEIMDAARAAEPEGVNIDLFYLSYLAPSDLNGELEIVDKLKNFYMGEDRASNDEETFYTLETYIYNVSYARRSRDGARLRVLNDSQATYIRESYSNHIHYAHRVGDEELLRKIFLQTIEIEKALREIVDFQAEHGIIPKSIDTREETFAQALAVLNEQGIEAIRLQ